MLILLTVAIVIGGFVLPSEKKYTFAMLVWMWILFAFNTMNGDYLAYVKIYNGIGRGNLYYINNYEEGFVFLCRFFARQGFSYQQFIIVIAAVCTLLFWFVIHLYTKYKNQNLVISLFMIFCYWMMICQYRTYLSFLFALIGIYYLFDQNNMRGIVIFLICILAGFLFHRMSAFFLVLLFVKLMKKDSILWLVPIIALGAVLMRSDTFISFVARFLPAYKMQRWLLMEGNRSLTGIVILIAVRTLLVMIEHIIMQIDTGNVEENIRLVDEQDYILKISLLCLTVVPLEVIVKDYERISRISLFLFFIFIANYMCNHYISTEKMPVLYLAMFGYLVLFMFSYYISFSGWFPHNLVPILTQNLLFGT